MPCNGSSKTNRLGLRSNAFARRARWNSPPERSFIFLLYFPIRLTLSNICKTSSREEGMESVMNRIKLRGNVFSMVTFCGTYPTIS
ncbi:hypothetical protein FXW31_03945 [Candidatus Liberibacter asiaticus]|nr:hypothetical protein FXW31_03945 [Candidatus Liberibacter asiaticus]